MPRFYVPLDVNFPDDHAVQSCQPRAQLLYVRALCLSKRTESDGYVTPRGVAALSTDLQDLDTSAETLARELTNARLWEWQDGRYRITRWLDHNASREELEALRQKDRERKRRGGRASGERVRASGRNPEVEAEAERATRESYSDEFDTCWKLYPRKLNRLGALKAFQARRREGITFGALLNATTAYAEHRAGESPDHTMHGATFFGPNERWKDYLEAVEPEAEKAVEKPSESIRICGSCGSPTWVAGTGHVPCDCPADGEA